KRRRDVLLFLGSGPHHRTFDAHVGGGLRSVPAGVHRYQNALAKPGRARKLDLWIRARLRDGLRSRATDRGQARRFQAGGSITRWGRPRPLCTISRMSLIAISPFPPTGKL